MIEFLNQLAIFNRRRFLTANQSLRSRTTDAVMRLLSGNKEDAELDAGTASLLVDQDNQQIFDPQERRMIERVLNLNQRTVSSIMTSRHDIEHIDLSAPESEVRALLEKNQHTRLVVTGGDNDEDLLGVVHIIDLLQQSLRGEPWICEYCFASPWSSLRRCRCYQHWSSSVTRELTSLSWSMNLVL